MDFKSSDVKLWREALSSYPTRIESLKKPNLATLDHFYRNLLPPLIRQRSPNPHITTSELAQLMQPRLLDFVSSLEDEIVKSASEKAFKSLPDVSKAVSELTVMKGVGPATASAVLAAYSPDVAPFMSDEAMVAALGSSKDYTLKQYLVFVDKLQAKAKELSATGDTFTPSDVERALWSSSVGSKLPAAQSGPDSEAGTNKRTKRKRKI
ncbi:hypothetical protein RJ639_038818 [Escallonia herrerae]|uniref:Uncharacterized protein n=1 Tax=Escallonia herrerae TaxID=1293975 RepID=A0AA89B7D0_9ASTE|nr:hypothetical protein RJ639_038818 [Escallonia herrerae]